MKVGDKLEWFEQLMSEGKDVPLMREQPELTQWEAAMWNAFSYLSNRRQSGMGLAPISISDLRCYLDDDFIFDQEIRSDYRHFIVFLDNLFLKKKSDEMENKRSVSKNNKPPAKLTSPSAGKH